ncbi:MAG: ribonuclease III domain-containing protein [Bacilli bacterium]|nr:ribonuclease III domain-containing protein [Bacilli bacterium]
MNNLVLAYLGDAAYELYIREYLINSGLVNVNDLQNASLNYVSAKSQRRILESLENLNIITDSEQNIIKRGRNASSHKSKNVDIITYKKATGLECLLGYLYLNDKNRFKEIMKYIVGEL